MNYTPLFGLPILMAAVLGTLTLALGTTAAVTLLLLLWAWWTGDQSSSDDAQRYLQSALTGTGYFVVSYLVHQLSARLVGEQEVAERSRMKAQVQTQISTLVIEHLNDGVLVVDEQIPCAWPTRCTGFAGDGQNTALPVSLGNCGGWQPLVALAHRTFDEEQPQTADVALLHPGESPMGLHVRTWLTSTPAIKTAAPSGCA